MKSILHLDGLTKNFGALRVTDNVTLDLSPGECHALIGPNGAGKSTLIHQISGILRPDSGRLVFDGHDISGMSLPERSRAGLGRTFQITSVIPGFTALENVALAAQGTDGTSLRFFGNASREKALNDRAHEALATLGLGARTGVVAAALSHGERRLLELAIAIVAGPKALLLDEPMAGMGKAESETLTETLLTLKADLPMLLVEHDMDAVFALADRVSVLAYGAIIASGTPDEVRADARARAAYLGEDAA